MKTRDIIRIILIVILLGVFLLSTWYVVDYYVAAAQQKEKYDSLASIVESIRKDDPSVSWDDPLAQTVPGPTEFEDTILPEYLPLYQMNSDTVGWISIEGTRVNYPVMQRPEETDYYLYRNFDQEYSKRGSLYVRETCDVFAPSDNVTIYGHHMADGSMFHGLLKYDEKSFYEEHPIIRFDTLTERHTYQIFAVFKTTASADEGFSYHRFENAGTQEEFDRFVATCKRISFYDTDHTPQYGDKLICLSTCEYTLENGRFVVVAYRVE